jgi:small subunit ribosomal protein S1
MERGDVLELPVLDYNRGGLVVGWNGLHGFVPASHLLSLPPALSEEERYAELQRMVGTTLRLKIIEVYPEQNRIVLSERATRYDVNGHRELLDSLSAGDVCQGTVSRLCPFGAFVDLGGVEGLVHVSELSWERVGSPDEVLEVGQSVKVYVLDVNRERGRVRLSIKRLCPNPWLSAEERYRVGQIVEGVVTHVADFGAFVRVEDGLEALLHASEMAEEGFVHPRDVLQKGDRVSARVIVLDGERRRMGLSLRHPGWER